MASASHIHVNRHQCRVVITHGESLGGLLSIGVLGYIAFENLRVFAKHSQFFRFCQYFGIFLSMN
jgi:hypothetical protein